VPPAYGVLHQVPSRPSLCQRQTFLLQKIVCCGSCLSRQPSHLLFSFSLQLQAGKQHMVNALAMMQHWIAAGDYQTAGVLASLLAQMLVGPAQGSSAPFAFLSAPGASSAQTSVHAVEEPWLPLENLSALDPGAPELQCALKGGRPLAQQHSPCAQAQCEQERTQHLCVFGSCPTALSQLGWAPSTVVTLSERVCSQ
jgi:hypothetical protein